MRKIKFRGYDTRDGVREMMTFTLDELLAGTDDYELVDPDSVVQFIGYDADGKEVYEGDALVDEEGMPINSLYVGIIDSDSNAIDGEIGDQFGDVWLEKE